MDRNGTSISELENQDLENLRTRADAVRNAMATAVNVLAFAGSSLEMKASAIARINAHYELLAGRTTANEDYLNFMRAVDMAAEAAETAERASGASRRPALDLGISGLGAVNALKQAAEDPRRAILDRLPPELARRFKHYTDDWGRILLAWRVKDPGRRRGHQGKWAEIAAFWKTATGEETSKHVWERIWKEYQYRIEAEKKAAKERADAANKARGSGMT